MSSMVVNVGANIGAYESSMDRAALIADQRMGQASSSVKDFRAGFLTAADDIARGTLLIGNNMAAANSLIIQGSAHAQQAILLMGANVDDANQKIVSSTDQAFKQVEDIFDKFEVYSKAKAIVIGAILAGTIAGAFYTAYKVIEGSYNFIEGLFTGDSYKSDNIDALIKANDQIKEIQNSLYQTAQQATATNAALATIGVDKTEYINVFKNAEKAIRTNTEELDRLGVKYKDVQGNLLPLEEVVKNASITLNEYTEGWDRNSAATAIGLGTVEQVAAAVSVTREQIQEAANDLNEYNLGIGDESQAAVARYQAAMKDFDRQTELTKEGFKRAIADNVMPILTDLAEYFRDGFPMAVNAFRYSMATVTSLFYGLKTVAYLVAESVIASVSAIGSVLGGVATGAARLMLGDFTGAKNALVEGWGDAQKRIGLAGDNIVAQATRNAAAMKLAWGFDDRTATAAGGPRKRTGTRTFVPKPDEEDDEKETPKDDVAKKVMEGALKAQEDLIADEKKMLQIRQQFLKQDYDSDLLSAKTYYSEKEKFIENNLNFERQAYNKEIEALLIFRKTRDKESEKIGVDNKIAEIKRKQAQAEIDANKAIADSYFDLLAAKRTVADALLKTDEKENKAFAKNIGLLNAFKDARIENEAEANDLIEKERDRHNKVMADMQSNNNLQSISMASDVAGQLYGILEKSGKEKSALGKTLFLAEKALAVAQIIVNTEAGAAKALGFGPFGIPMATVIRALGYASAGIVAGTAIAGAFADGGEPPVGKMSLVGERGPELFIPKSAGTIIPNHMLGSGSGGAMKLTVINQTSAPIGNAIERRLSNGERVLIIQEAVAASLDANAAQFDNPNSRLSKSASRNYNLQRNRS